MKKSNNSKNRLTLVAIFILAIFCALMVWPSLPASTPGVSFWNKFNFKLGLDLQGGTHLVYQADTSKLEGDLKESAVEGVRDVIERRVNAFGVAEPLVQTNVSDGEYRIIVELAGIKDTSQAIAMIGETPILEFKEQNPNFSESLTIEQTEEMAAENEKIKENAQNILNRVSVGEDFAEIARQQSEDSSASSGGDLGWATRGLFVPEFDKAIFEDLKDGEKTKELIKTDFGYHVIERLESRIAENGDEEVHARHILLKTKSAADFIDFEDAFIGTNLSGKHLKRTSVQFDSQTNEPEVGLEFDSEGKDLFADITKRNVGLPVAIFIDGVPISIPTVNMPITDGQAIISGNFSIQEAKELSQNLNAGALPVPIEIISQQTVGASLGNESVEKSLFAGLIGLIAVALFMIIIYRLPGLLAVVSLIIYTTIVLTIFEILSVTLTLAGVAGFILSVGMAVDANVLIFERMKEELKNGRRTTSAVEEGFKRAWTSIKDSNLSTIITCLILIWFGASVVQGFAITLIIGVLISMFSAVVITRTFLRVVVKNDKVGKKILWFLGINKPKTILEKILGK